ncbi:unnamed protein product [Rotaria sordida]|uniref:G-protein coupled receptors family 1 profile domain-containing protein n=1 Tax=Rotaria sordida TaxID=392033 RepID=A0A815PPW0_9BILA|nr:unnamed protein product [Rotaria sordida]CAF1451766.1 unnamed protein product [Rotaria sordida]
MSSSENYYIEVLTKIPIYLHQYIATILFIIGNIGNLLSILIFFKKSWKKNVCVFYFTVFLLNNTVFLNSAVLGSILIIGFNINVLNSNVILCKIFYYIAYLCSTYLPCILICASIDRLLISSQNVDTRLYSSKRLAYFFISTSLFVLSMFSVHVLIKVNIQQFTSTLFVCYYDFSKFYLNFFIYSTLIISVVLSLALIILSIIAFNNVRHIQIIPRQQRKQIRSMNKKDFQLLRCLYVHNIIYIICTIVLVVGLVYSTTIGYGNQNSFVQAVNNFLNKFGGFLHYIPYCTSFFIFVCLSKAFRQELKRFVYKICGKDITILQEEENKDLQPARNNIDLNVVVNTIALAS